MRMPPEAVMLGGAMGLSLLGIAQEPESYVDAVGGRYAASGGPVVELLGVCEFRTAGVRCWNSEGIPAVGLSDQITEHFRTTTIEDAQFRRGFKNRYFVFKSTGDVAYELRSVGSGSFRVGANETLTFARVLLEPDVERFEGFVTLLNTGSRPSATLPFKRGETLSYQGYQFELGSVAPLPGVSHFVNQGAFGGQPALSAWSVTWGVQPPRAAVLKTSRETLLDMRYELLDKKGQPIQYVNDQGNPISEAVYRASLAKTDIPALEQSRKNYLRATFTPMGMFRGESAAKMMTDVNPTQIGSIRITAKERARVRFPNLPADPALQTGGGQ